ncbi:Camelysin metallo-endopeptidase [Blastococcus aurantiacus]|uniref:Camelysin metallo-endopeptidase n=1 Tax=Blastococcus aurantiacus TaxID=1550231 RepID=A0A1G7QM15_9ACTN|nr:TasA family protein [Blastococcus aurantiacus]SDF99546.1 Camelysin metallo-endopeptidase [Blastococcus aurantiacus]
MTPERSAARPGRRARRLGLAACVLVAVVGSSLVVWQSAYATFADSAGPVTATASTGTLTLGDDDAGSTLFGVSDIKPGDNGTRCIRVTANGTAPATVRMYGTGRSSSAGLAAAMTLTVHLGTGGSAASCNGFSSSALLHNGSLAAFTAEGFAAGLGSWTAPGRVATARTYRIAWSLPSSAPLSAEGGSAAVSFVWEAQTR